MGLNLRKFNLITIPEARIQRFTPEQAAQNRCLHAVLSLRRSLWSHNRPRVHGVGRENKVSSVAVYLSQGFGTKFIDGPTPHLL